jgi:hypothetical protein
MKKHFPVSIHGKASLHIGHSFFSLASLHSVQSLLLHHGKTYLSEIRCCEHCDRHQSDLRVSILPHFQKVRFLDTQDVILAGCLCDCPEHGFGQTVTATFFARLFPPCRHKLRQATSAAPATPVIDSTSLAYSKAGQVLIKLASLPSAR